MSALKTLEVNRVRLRMMLQFAETLREGHVQLNLATFLTTHRQHESRAPIGCLLGHFARTSMDQTISLVPINFISQVKSPIMAGELIDEFPSAEWRHWTLRYMTSAAEAYGETAATLWLQMGKWDLHRLFYPAGQSYEIRPPIESLIQRLDNMVRTLG